MVDLLAERPRTTGELAAAFPKLSRFAVMKHLRVLQKAGLLVVTRDGRKKWNSLNAVPLRQVLRRWMSRHDEFWAEALINIRDVTEGERPTPGPGEESVPSSEGADGTSEQNPGEGKEGSDEGIF